MNPIKLSRLLDRPEAKNSVSEARDWVRKAEDWSSQPQNKGKMFPSHLVNPHGSQMFMANKLRQNKIKPGDSDYDEAKIYYDFFKSRGVSNF